MTVRRISESGSVQAVAEDKTILSSIDDVASGSQEPANEGHRVHLAE